MSMVKVGEINMEYYVEGSGAPLLLISGFTSQASGWSEPFTAIAGELLDGPLLAPGYRHERAVGGGDHSA